MADFLRELGAHLRLADLLDVTLVALCLYAGLTWARESLSRATARRTLAVVALFGALYGLARLLELYLMESILEVLLVVGVLVAVVAFQADIRRMVDRLGAWALRTSRPRPAEPIVDLLTEAAAKLADENTGALIALHGREPWDRYVKGGVELDGQASLPFLISVFNPQAPGHDGAVLMEGDRITHFAAHLPLAEHVPEVSRFGGTRHAAACGLSEVCDALVIVVSEERGAISVAEHGTLETLEPSQLKQRLSAFWDLHYSEPAAATPAWWNPRSLQHASLALATAIGLWLLFAYRPDTLTQPYSVPIELRNLTNEWRLDNEDDVPAEARVTLIGPEQAFRQLDEEALRISVDLARLHEGVNTFEIDEEMLALPPGIDLYRAIPRELELEAAPQQAITVPVEVATRGALPDSLELVGLRAVPAEVALLISDDEDVIPPSEMITEDIDLSRITESTQVRRGLVPTTGVRLPPGADDEVLVEIEVQRRTQ